MKIIVTKCSFNVWLILGTLVFLMLCGCGKPRYSYTITIKNDTGSQMDGVVLSCEAFSCEFEAVPASTVSAPTECKNDLPETGRMLIVRRDGSQPAWQNVQLRSKVGEGVNSAAIEVVVNRDGTITLNSTARPLPSE